MEKQTKWAFDPYLQFKDEAKDWQSAIRQASQPLLENDVIEARYIEAMIQNVIEHGEYIVLAPRVAMPHARPEAGAKETGISILRLDKPVSFGETGDVSLIICLATKDDTQHLEMLQQISYLIDEEEKVEQLLQLAQADAFIEKANEFIQKES